MEQPWFRDGCYYVSPHNFHDDVRAAFSDVRPPGEARLYDSTLRKILLTPGLVPTVPGMLRVARAVERLGVGHVALNVHWWGESRAEELEWAVAEAVLRNDFSFTTTITVDNATSPRWRDELAPLVDLGLREPTFVISPRRGDEGTRSPQETYDRVSNLMAGSIALGADRPAVVFTDAGRAEWADLVGLARAAVEAGASRIDVADSAGSMGPHAVRVMLTALRRELGPEVPLLLHIHDDFGLATAAALEAVGSGALVETSLNGISDRGGFPATEEVVVALESMYGIETGLDIGYLSEACAIAAAESLPPHPWKAISGTQAFQLDLPYAVHPTLDGGRDRFPPAWSCVDPRWLGTTAVLHWLRQFLTGPVLSAKLRSLDLPADAESVAAVRAVLAGRLLAHCGYPVWIEEEVVDELCRSVLWKGF